MKQRSSPGLLACFTIDQGSKRYYLALCETLITLCINCETLVYVVPLVRICLDKFVGQFLGVLHAVRYLAELSQKAACKQFRTIYMR